MGPPRSSIYRLSLITNMYRIGIRPSPVLQRSFYRASGLVATVTLGHWYFPSRYTSSEPKKEKEEPVFDLTKEWERATTEGVDYFKKWIVTNESKEIATNDTPSSDTTKLSTFLEGAFRSPKDNEIPSTNTNYTKEISLISVIKDISSIILGDDKQEDAMKNLVKQARNSTSGKGDIKDFSSFAEILQIMQDYLQNLHKYQKNLDRTLQDNFGHLDLSGLFPTSLYYYVEREDEVKNPSWKRRKHRFHRGVDIEQVNDLNAALYLAELSYADSVEEVKEGLKNTRYPVELVYCDTESEPGKPAHFIILKTNQSMWSSGLEVTLVVRGTQNVADALTDAYLEAADYRGGKAHAGILESGKYLVEKHTELLEKLCKLANKRKVKLTLVGHSLGAGAAAIAGIEFNDNPMMDAMVIGFGCPSLLSKELSESTAPFIETVIADADMIPRMNGATISNKLLDIMEHDWIPEARRDIVHTLDELQRVAPGIMSESAYDYILSLADSWFESYVKPTINETTTERKKCILFPPGTCIHFYRDGSGITGSQPPCTFFDDIDVVRTMVDDHLIDKGYRRIFLELMRQYRRDHHFSFEEDSSE